MSYPLDKKRKGEMSKYVRKRKAAKQEAEEFRAESVIRSIEQAESASVVPESPKILRNSFDNDLTSNIHKGLSVLSKETHNVSELQHDGATTQDPPDSILASGFHGSAHCSEEFVLKECTSSSEENEEIQYAPSSVYLPILCAAFSFQNGLTKTAVDQHLKLVSIAANCQMKKLTSSYNLFSDYKHLKREIQITYVCRKQKCDNILDKGEDGYPITDQKCGHKHMKNFSNDCFVARLPIEAQLKNFVKNHGLECEETWKDVDANIRSDVNSGRIYRELREKEAIGDNTVTLQLNADGAQCFKTSKFSFWPLMAIVNEASYKLRRQYVILLAIWYGNKKPPLEAFLTPSIDELQRLQQDGFEVDGKMFTLRLLIITTDTPARSQLCNTGQFNGIYGCNFCLHPGERVVRGKGTSRVYTETNVSYPLRTMEQTLSDILKMESTGEKSIHGIKGRCPFMRLEGFDYVQALIPEYLHSGCEGVFKKILVLYTSRVGGNTRKNWFIGKKLRLVNTRLSNTRPPYEVTRTIESISEFKDWKASTYRTFILYFFPVLDGILPKPYFENLCDLSYGMYLLLQDRVLVDDVVKAGILLKRFVVDFERLYGKEHVSINVHFMTHLSQSVLDWGCLWSTSTFIPEWFIGELNKLCSGTQHVVRQMAFNYLARMSLRSDAIKLIRKENLPPNVTALMVEMLNLPAQRELTKGLDVNEDKIRLLSVPSILSIPLEQEVAIKNLIDSDVRYSKFNLRNASVERCSSFERLLIRKTRSIFTTSKYIRSPKRNNFIALMADDSFLFIEHILFVENLNRAFIVGKQMGVCCVKVFLPKHEGDIQFSAIPGQTTVLVGLSSQLIAYDPVDIKKKCVVAMHNILTETFIVTAIANNFESD